jgi:hypothetical protein
MARTTLMFSSAGGGCEFLNAMHMTVDGMRLTFHAASVDPNVEAQIDDSLHLLNRPCKAMHKPPFGQLVQPYCQQALKVFGSRTRVQKQWKLNLDGNGELGFEVL